MFKEPLIVLLFLLLVTPAIGCTTFVVTPGASENGEMYVGHTNDGLGECVLGHNLSEDKTRVVYIPPSDHPYGSERPVLYDPNAGTDNPGGEEKDKKTHEIRSGTDLKEEITENSKKTENDPDKVSDIQEEILRYKENNKIVIKTTLCEICGSAVTPKAEHASKVIAGRVLCRKCLDRMKR